jgi:hypothetical protein
LIYVDPTEVRDDTRLPPAVIRAARELPHLEAVTGADLFLTPHKAMIPSLTGEMGKSALRWHLEHGAILVQRKSGRDFLSSVPDLDSIVTRMLEWESAWLLVTGLWPYTDESGKAFVDGQRTDWDFDAAEGALVSWQARGGCVQLLPDDWAIGGWLTRMLDRTRKWANEPIKRVIQHQSTVTAEDDWVTSGSAFPMGIGLAKREALRDAIQEAGLDTTLVTALAWATGDCGKVPGFGKVLSRRCREWIGLPDYARIVPHTWTEVTLTLPPGSKIPTVKGKWTRLPDGSINASYSPEEADVIIALLKVTEE